MATWINNVDEPSDDNNVEAELSNKLDTLKQEHLDCIQLKNSQVAVVDATIEDEWETLLSKIKNDQSGARNVLIACKIGSSHWIGIWILFGDNDRIERAQFIDPVEQSSFNPENLQRRFTKYYPNHSLTPRTIRKNTDPKFSAQLTIENLIEVVRQNQINRNTRSSRASVLEGNSSESGSFERLEIRSTQRSSLSDQLESASQFDFNPDYTRRNREQMSSASSSIGENCSISTESLTNMYQDCENMPLCLEKSLLTLLFYIALKQVDQTNTLDACIKVPDDIDVQIEKEYDYLKERAKKEEIQPIHIQKLINTSHVNAKNQNWRFARDQLKTVLKSIRPLDIPKLFRLVEKVDDATALIEGQDIVLFLGGSGSGKSTTIHFFGETIMTKTLVDGVFHLQLTEIKNPDLYRVTTAPRGKSETRHIIPVRICLEDNDDSDTNESIILCDTPGFEDTTSAEIDIANGISIIKAIKGCKSVRPVVVVSYKGIGDRFQGLRSLTHILAGLISGISDQIRSFSFIFTKYPEVERKHIHESLKSIRKDLNESEKSDKNFMKFFDEMIKKTKQQAITIDPIEDDRKEILGRLIESDPIEHPEEVFRFSITETSKAIVQDQGRKHQLSISFATKRFDYLLVKYKLDELRQLSHLLSDRNLEQIYNECVQSIRQHLTQEYEQGIKDLDRCLQHQTIISDDDIKQYETKINQAKLAENLRNEHLGTDVVQTSSFIQYLNEQVKDFVASIQSKETNHSSVKIALEKIQIVSKYFPHIVSNYNSICERLTNEFDLAIESYEKSVRAHEFDKCANELKQLSEILNIVQKRFDSDRMETKYEQAKTYFIQYLKDTIEKFEPIFKQEYLEKNMIENLTKCFTMLETALNTYTLYTYISKEKINEIYKQLLENVSHYFEMFINKIDMLINEENEHLFQFAESKIEDLNLLRTIPSVQLQTNQSYYRILENLLAYFRKSINYVEHKLIKFRRHDEETNYSRLAQYLSNLKYAKWMEKYYGNVCVNMMTEIEEFIIEHLVKLKNSFVEINLDLDNHQQIAIANKIVCEINEMKCLAVVFDHINERINEVNSLFIETTKKILDMIKETYCGDHWKENRYQLLDFDRIEKALSYLNACRKAVRLSCGDSASVLNSLRMFIQEFSNFIHDEMSQCFDEIKTGSNTNLAKNIRIIFNRLREIIEIRKSYQQMFACFSNGKIYEYWQAELNRLSDDLKDDLDRLKPTKQTEKISLKLAIVKELRRIDEFLDEKSFSELHDEYQKIFSTQTKTAEIDVFDAIKKKEYERIRNEMDTLKGSGEIGEQSLQQAKRSVQTDIENLMDETKRAVMFGDKIDLDEIRTIESNLKQIERASRLLDEYIGMSKQVKEFIQEIIQSLSHRIERYLTKIQALINTCDFVAAQQEIELILSVRDILGKSGYCTKEISGDIDKLSEYENTAVTNIIKQYETLDIDEYASYSPRALFEKLEKVRTTNLAYSLAQDKIKQVIMSKFRAEIAKVATRIVADPQSVYVERLRSALTYLPYDLKTSLEKTLEYTSKESEQTIVNSNNKLKEVCDTHNVSNIKSLLQEYQTTPGMQIFVDKGREIIIKQMRELASQIFESLNQYDIREALVNVKMFYDYKIELKNILGENSQLNFDIEIRVKDTFRKAYSCVNNQFFFANMSTISNEIIQVVEKSFVCLLEFMKFRDESADQLISRILPNHFDLNIQEFHQKFSNYIHEIQSNYVNALRPLSIQSLVVTLTIVLKWNSLFMKINEYKHLDNHTYTSVYPLLCILQDLPSYTKMATSISEIIKNSINELINIELINDETKDFCQQRNQFYSQLNEKLLVLEQLQLLNGFEGITNINKMKQDCITSYETKLAVICSYIDGLIQDFSKNPRLNIHEYDQFNLYYNNLFAFHEQIKVTFFQVKDKIKLIDENILSLTQSWANTAETSTKIEDIARYLINMKRISNNILLFRIRINEQIDIVLNHHKGQARTNDTFSKLGAFLNGDVEGIGQAIISEHKAFQGFSISLFNVKVQRLKIGYVLDNLKISSTNKEQLQKRYNDYEKLYKELIQQHLKQDMKLERLITETKLIFGDSKQITNELVWDGPVRNKIPKLLAHIFALWTLKNASHYFEAISQADKNNYLVQPHAGQIIAIFLVLGIGIDNERKLNNNLVQVGTGEGKSVVLAVTSCVLALAGFDVWCACYSEQLSTRDYQQFHSLFDTLGILPYIHYGTFNKLSEDLINQHGEVRQIVEQLISNNSTITMKTNQEIKRAKILLVDEVDVFFSQDFYGNVYTPSARLRDPTIVSLVDFIWVHREQKLYFQEIQQSQEYIDCKNRFPNWISLIDEAIKDMLSDIRNFQSHDYVIKQDKIGYVEQDNIIFNANYGYKTLFAYYFENQNGKISRKSLEEYISIFIRCGSFSYAEMPFEFQVIMGVTGTLETLNDIEKEIVQQQYKIQHFRVIPSVFGKNNLRFVERDDFMIENQDDYYNRIQRQIIDRLQGRNMSDKRAVLVFFESKKKLMDFYLSDALVSIRHSVAYLTEEQSTEEKLHRIRSATVSGQITLFTRTFGRGTDFICHDQTIAKNGGTHLIQTFLSETESEEVQIKGRTARQGDEGSYSLILLDSDLEKFHITKQNIQDIRDDKGIDVCVTGPNGTTTRSKKYKSVREFLSDRRRELFRIQHQTTKKYVELAADKHKKCQKFLGDLLSADTDAVREFLVEENRGVEIEIRVRSRTVCLMDATGSMAPLLTNCKATVGTMFERAATVLRNNSISGDSFQLQFVVYRNYNSKRDKILQSSSWETKPDNLRAFINPIQVDGGWGHEAIEIGLWHANKENEREPITQVIIIGDASPNTREEVTRKRERLGEQYWGQTDLKKTTYYEDELEKLTANKIPVHCFYVARNRGTEDSFREMANRTHGQCAFLEINSDEGADKLTDFVTKEILRNVGGNDFVAEYERTYPKTYL